MSGPPGTGKTTTAIAFVKELFGPNAWKYHCKSLNASNERGKLSVRVRISMI